MIRKSLLALALAVLAGAASATSPIRDFDPTLCGTAPNASPKGQPPLAKPARPRKAAPRAVKSSPRKAIGIPRGWSAAAVRPRPKIRLANLPPVAFATLAAAPVRAPTHACPELGRGTLFSANPPDGTLATLLAGKDDDPAAVHGNGGWGNSDGNLSAIVNQNTEPRHVGMDPMPGQFHAGRTPLNRNTLDLAEAPLSDEFDSLGKRPGQAPRGDSVAPEIDLRPLLRPTISGYPPEDKPGPLAPFPAGTRSVPEPATLALLALGYAGMAWSRRRTRG